MAESAIPGLDVYDPAMERMARRMRVPPPSAGTMYGTPQGVALDPGAAEAVRRTSSMRIQQPLPPEAKFQGPQQPLPESRPWTATDGTARPPETVPAGERIRGAGAATGQGIKTAGQAAGEMLKSAGRGAVQDVLKGGMRSTGILSGISETAGHGNAYFDDNVPLGDKLRIGATDLVATAGSTLGAVGGGLFGAGAGSVVPGPGTVVGGVAGGVAGGYAGHKAGRAAGNFLFGGDEALQRHGYDPQRGIVDVAKDAISGKSGEQMFGQGDAARMRPIPAGNSTAGAGRGSVNPPMIVPDAATPNITAPRRDGVIYREGNSYSGTGNIAFGAEIDNARNPGVGVTSLDFSEGRRQDAMELARMRAAAPQGPTMGGFAGGEQIGMAREGGTANFGPSLSVLGPSGNAMKPRDVRAANAIAAERAIASERMANERNLARMREGGDMARANLNAGVARENNAAQISATMRGQDITREGHMVTAQGNRMRMQYDMAKDQRDYTTGRADKAFEQRSARETQLQKNLEAVNTVVDSDGKPQVNARAVADMRQGIDRAVARMGIAGPHELGPQAEQQLIAASSLLKTMQENAGYLPWKPDKLKTIDPYDLTGLKVLPNGDRQITRPGQALGQIIPARFFRTEEGARFFGGTPTNRYDMLGAN